jgi:hypothetical protein
MSIGELFAVYRTMKEVQEELTHLGAEAVWTFIWEVNAIQVKIWYKMANDHRSVVIHLSEKDFSTGIADRMLESKIEMIARDIADQKYLCTQKERV